MTFVLIVLMWSGSEAVARNCETPPAEVLRQTRSGRTVLWRLDSHLYQKAFSSNDRGYVAYQSWVRRHTAWNGIQLLRNHIRVGQRLAKGLPASDEFRRDLENAERMARLVISGSVGRIRRLSCIEGIAFSEFLRIADLKTRPMEFGATLLKKGGSLVLIADFYRSNSDIVGVAETRVAANRRRAFMRQGYSLLAHLHNHPFNFTNSYGDFGGVLLPSSADEDVYRSLQPRQAVITNGLESVVFTRRDLRALGR